MSNFPQQPPNYYYANHPSYPPPGPGSAWPGAGNHPQPQHPPPPASSGQRQSFYFFKIDLIF